MSIFGTILSTIFGHAGAAPPAATPATTTPATPPAGQTPAPVATPAPSAPVDVAAILTDLAAKAPQKLNWQQSIVDLMKLLGLDNSLAARKQLAEELHYTGDTNDSASMNVWLHRQVMQKLAENGGKVPDDLK
ncbi:DUF3597 domain-containing protein [Gluconacetobacter asukensis]|uniref:DUF3597 domain-containing protein n=1 Tax=Gluconacetobacter asukensis TaxID=1017181 RepID=A0A7W4J1V1_9PROT|nr:DUF3597 domain-containing protein [Gluconacetobacter asukensis]MBB2173163.1 DUF3597 domain-containing protein [Gluconacetobacter asukensis]